MQISSKTSLAIGLYRKHRSSFDIFEMRLLTSPLRRVQLVDADGHRLKYESRYPSVTILFRWHRNATSIALALFAFIVLFSLAAIAQTSPADHPRRMKVGVALEGGGALGLAHIGVLRWFEQHHIPIDYLSGNSMGGLVRAARDWPEPRRYRTNSEENGLAIASRWRNPVSRLLPPERRCTGGSKHSGHWFQKRTRPSLRVEWDIRSVSHRPGNASLLNVKSFGRLTHPVPLHCHRLGFRKGHAFSSGPIGLAMRSTMSLPGIFDPVRVGDSLLVDGEH